MTGRTRVRYCRSLDMSYMRSLVQAYQLQHQRAAVQLYQVWSSAGRGERHRRRPEKTAVMLVWTTGPSYWTCVWRVRKYEGESCYRTRPS